MGNSPQTEFHSQSTAEDVTKGLNLSTQSILITGANTGIGKESSRVLAKRGATVYMVARNKSKVESAIKDIIDNLSKDEEYASFIKTNNITNIKDRLIPMICDLSSLESVYNLGKNIIKQEIKLNSIICNAGIYCPKEYYTTKDGFESQFGVNHLSHYYLVRLLLPKLCKNKCRIVCVASTAHKWIPDNFKSLIIEWYKNNTSPNKKDYNPEKYYGISKSCNILFSRGLVYLYKSSNIESVSLHPGVIRSDLFREKKVIAWAMNTKLGKKYTKSVEQGAATQIRCCTMKDNDIKLGNYYADCNDADDKLCPLMKHGKLENEDDWKKSMEYMLWELSEKLIVGKGFKINVDENEDGDDEKKVEENVGDNDNEKKVDDGSVEKNENNDENDENNDNDGNNDDNNENANNDVNTEENQD